VNVGRKKKRLSFQEIQKAELKNAQEFELINRMCDRHFLEANAEFFEWHFMRLRKLQGLKERLN